MGPRRCNSGGDDVLPVLMTYVTAASLVLIPMSVMEAAILGPLFTALRILVSLPLVIIGSIFIEKLLLRRGYEMPLVR